MSEHLVGGSTGAVGIIVDDWFSKARCFSQSRRPRNDGFKHRVTKVLPHFTHHLIRKLGASIEHRHHDAEQHQPRVYTGLTDRLQHAMNHGNTFKRIILALERNEDAIGRTESIERENAESRWTIDHDDFELPALDNGSQELRALLQMVFTPDEFNLDGTQVDLARDEAELIEGGALDFVGKTAFAKEGVIGAASFELLDTETARCIGLGVEVEEERAVAGSGDASSHVDGGRGLSHSAFLIGHSNDLSRHSGDLEAATRWDQALDLGGADISAKGSIRPHP